MWGTDILASFVDEANEISKKQNLDKKGCFIEASFQNSVAKVGTGNKFTHIISIGSLYYAHNEIDKCLLSIGKLADKSTTILIWDMNRSKQWPECKKFQRHMKLKHGLISQPEMLQSCIRCKLTVSKMVDVTKDMLPCLKIFRDAALEEDPTSEVITFPYVYDSFNEGEVVYPIWIMSKKL